MTIMIYLNAIPSNANSICTASDGFVFFCLGDVARISE